MDKNIGIDKIFCLSIIKMSYSLLGMSCKSQTIACTSNHKFLPLHSSEYLKRNTYMMQYPGNSSSTSLSDTLPKSGHKNSEFIKSYYGKIYENEENMLESPPMGKSCKDC